MPLLEMSVSAAIFILAAVVIRALGIHKLPHKCFLALWAVALVLLFVPLRFPSPVSLFKLLAGPGAPLPQPVQANLPTLTGAGMRNGATSAGLSSAFAAGDVSPAHTFWQLVSPWLAVWLVGCIACALFFLLTHLRCRTRYRTALPCESAFVKEWLAAHPLHRPVQVRVSDQITAPLTYGVLRPVILLPKNFDWPNEKLLSYVLTHEWMHIRRFDVAFKTLLVAAVCLHWFNPMVWVLFVLAGRDIELACDEAVVRHTNPGSKKDYALALVNLEERKSRFAPLSSSFSKNGVEERIKGILKEKKATVLSVALAVLLVAGTVTVFATSAAAQNATPPAPDGNTPFRYALPGEAGNHSGYTEADYTALMALKTDGYREETLAGFNARFASASHLWGGYNPKDENIEFLVTLGYSAAEIVADEWGEVAVELVTTGSNINVGTGDYYGAQLDYAVRWEIADPDKLTVGARDDMLNRCHVGVQTILEAKTKEELADADIVAAMQAECNALAKECSTSAMSVAIKVQGIHPAAADSDFVRQEYPLLLALRTGDWQDLTLSAFRAEKQEAIAADEAAYFAEIDSCTRDNRMDRIRYTDPDASFVLNTLIPLVAEKWDSWRYGGMANDEAGYVEYSFTLTIRDANAVTVRQRDEAWQGMSAAIQSAYKNATAAQRQDADRMQAMLQTAAETAAASANPGLLVELDYIQYMPDNVAQDGGKSAGDASDELIPPPATNEQLNLLFALMTPGYKEQTVEEFRISLLETYQNKGEERYMEAIEAVDRDFSLGWQPYPLTYEQLLFLQTTLPASNCENLTLTISPSFFGARFDPSMTGSAYRERTGPAHGNDDVLLFMVRPDYLLTWRMQDPGSLTVGERDAALNGVLVGVQEFIDSQTEDALVGGQAALQAEIDRLVEISSTLNIKVEVSELHYQVLDERNLD